MIIGFIGHQAERNKKTGGQHFVDRLLLSTPLIYGFGYLLITHSTALSPNARLSHVVLLL